MSNLKALVGAAVAAVVIAAPLALAGPADAASSKISVQYTAVGTSHIKSIDSDLPIAKTKLVSTLNSKTLKIVAGTLPIAPQTTSFTALGLIPVRATTTLTQVGQITGTLTPKKKGNVLSTKVDYSIQLSDVEAQVLGQWVPLQVGDNCKTIDPVAITTASPKGKYFDIFKGGVVSGSYTIGQFQNCDALMIPGLGSFTVNALVPGSGNTVSLTLSHGKSVKS